MTINLGFVTQLNEFADDLVVRKQDGGFYDDNGEFIPGLTTDYSLKGSVEPIKDGIYRTNDVTGERSHETIAIYTTNKEIIRALRQNAVLTQGDIIIYNNTRYRVSKVTDWRNHGCVDVIAIRNNYESDEI